MSRVISLFQSGLMDSKEAIISINIQDLAGVELSEKDIEPPISNGGIETSAEGDIINKEGLAVKPGRTLSRKIQSTKRKAIGKGYGTT